MKVLATYSIKGGVGKTTAAVNLAHEAATSGARVLLWDLDPQGAATFFVRVRPAIKGGASRLVSTLGSLDANVCATDNPAVHIVPADFSLRHLDLHLDDAKRPTQRLGALLEPLADRYDVAILDCAPGITLTSESVFAAADALLVPTIPTTLSQRTLDQLLTFLADHPPSPLVLPFASMVDRRKRLQRDLVERLLTDAAGFLPTTIPNASVVERMGVERAPLAVFAPTNAAAIAYRELWGDIAARIWP
ncbi:MAG: ParA family protein [Acidimicrobiia bacterium]